MSQAAMTEPLVCPFSVVIDTREQRPYTFGGIVSDARDGRRPVLVSLVGGTLKAGDYSIEGLEQRIAVERKSLADLFSTLGQGRGRFQRELQRLNDSYDYAAVVCEEDWAAIVADPPERSMLRPKTVHRSVIAWQMRFSKVHWWMCPGRPFAERTTFRLLERYWKEQRAKSK